MDVGDRAYSLGFTAIEFASALGVNHVRIGHTFNALRFYGAAIAYSGLGYSRILKKPWRRVSITGNFWCRVYSPYANPGGLG